MPFLLILGAVGAAWYFGVWPFDGRTWKPRDTAYVAEVAYYVGKEIAYDTGSKRKTLQECRSADLSPASRIAAMRRSCRSSLMMNQDHIKKFRYMCAGGLYSYRYCCSVPECST